MKLNEVFKSVSLNSTRTLIIFMLVFINIKCFCAVAQSPPTSTLEISTGALQEEREKLKKSIEELEKQGVGIKPYAQSFSEIDELVKKGASAFVELKVKVDRLNRAVLDQQKTMIESKAMVLRKSEPTKPAAPTLMSRYCDSIEARLKKTWHPQKGVDQDVVLSFIVDGRGVLSSIEPTKSSKGDPAAHEHVRQLILELKNVGVPPTKKIPLKLVAECCDTHGIEVAEFTTASDVEFGPYMADLQRRLKRAWFPPKGNEAKRVRVQFKIHSDGRASNIRLSETSGMTIADLAALKAVQNAGPFRPLPNGSPPDVDIDFTFDYNVFKGTGGGGTFRRF